MFKTGGLALRGVTLVGAERENFLNLIVPDPRK